MPFNPTNEQQKILNHNCSNHARILAGPGTGKSATMVSLLKKQIELNPNLNIKMLTFTRAATAELAEKIQGEVVSADLPSTIHAFSISILLKNPGAGRFPEPLRIPDTWEFKEIVRPNLSKRIGIDVKIFDKLIQEMSANWMSLEDEKNTELSEELRQIFRGGWSEHRRIFGYTLLQELPYALLRALESYDNLKGINYDLLLVDEYQDLNSCDLKLLKLLSEKGGCKVVGTGDDDQSIYSWRKAAPSGIRNFIRNYDQASDYSLSLSLRCGSKIILWANHVIQGDPDRPSNRALLNSRVGSNTGEVGFLSFDTNQDEANGVSMIIRGLMAEEFLPKDILILTRSDHNGSFSKDIRTALQESGIPFSDPSEIYSILNDNSNRKILELLRLQINAEDSISWASILKLTDGVGESFVKYIYEIAKSEGDTFASVLLKGYRNDFKNAPSSSKKVKGMMDKIIPLIELSQIPEEMPNSGWGKWILEISRSNAMFSKPTESFSDLLEELDTQSDNNQSLSRYINQIEPMGKDLLQSKSEGVRIMTMGGSKGLTVRATIVVGVEDGIIPRPGTDMSEDRRILYVAMTRAKEILFCTWSKRRFGPTARSGSGSKTYRTFCPFLDHGPVSTQDGNRFINQRFIEGQ